MGESPAGRRARSYLARWGIAAVCLAFLVFVALTFRDYGVTWDESAQARYGELVVDYFASGLADRSYADLYNLRYYGAGFEALCAATYRALGTATYETRHFLTGLAALATVLATMLFGRLWRCPWVAICAGLALCTMPRFIGHALNNSKDIPFACAFAWSIWAITRMVSRDVVRPRDAVWSGIAIGAAGSIRIGGLILLGYAAAGLLIRGLLRRERRTSRETLRSLGAGMLLLLVAWTVMLAAWPWAHENVLANPLRALALMSDFEAAKEVLFRGSFFHSQDAPRYYLPWYLSITVPLPHLALAVLGIFGTLREARRARNAMLLLWLILPLAFFVVMRPTAYDGMRHYLFLLPAVAILASIGVRQLRGWAGDAGWRRGLTVLALLFLLWPMRDIVVLHPYQSSYFNGLVGGVGRAAEGYDTDYWASSYKEAAEWIRSQGAPGGRPPRVLLAGNARCRICASYYLQPGAKVGVINRRGLRGALPPDVDYYVSINRRRLDLNFPDARVLHTIRRDGATLAVIKGH